MLVPENVRIDSVSGAIAPETERYEKRLSELSQIFADREALGRMVVEGDPLVYKVLAYRKDGSDLWFGTTIIEAGDVGGEYFMTRGHFHKRHDMGEVYYTQSGKGVLVLQSRDGRVELLDMLPGTCSFIPPNWAHRSINVGPEPLVFVWVCDTEAGNDYGEILEKGMAKRVIVGGDGLRVVDRAD
ncbi:glucose-6-phosphate isomerase family protein [Mesorhizobium sp.]|uniref:glucose-6-phosphate isomerase family protein n=1 Tax=Mesorhizobium sp. TaxID=1871066 RepID=UPI0025CF9595|nr:glucose-6-phosphate isomerase family protein [Mesorhizobium sp.]